MNPTPNPETPLQSWKEIGAYLQRDAATARRWEKLEGLPVHRHTHQRRASVYAYPSEIDAWRESRKALPAPPPPRPLWKMPAFALTIALCLVMVGNGLHPQRVEAQTQSNRQIWAGADVSVTGSVSRDGRWLSVIVDNRDPGVRNLETGVTRRLTTRTEADRSSSAIATSISPDGNHVAYTWTVANTDTYQVRLVPAEGGPSTPRVLYSTSEMSWIAPFGWTPDGSGVFVHLVRYNQTHEIALIRISDGQVSVIKSLDWRATNMLSVSPDGLFIAYDFPPSENDLQHDVYVLSADGSREAKVVESRSDDLLVGWASDSKGLLFTSDRTGASSLWRIGVLEGQPAGKAAVVKIDFGGIMPLGIRADGALYYGKRQGVVDVHTISINPDTLQPTGEPVPMAQRFLGTNSSGEWSPDGKRLAWASRRASSDLGPRVITIHSLEDQTEYDLIPEVAYLNTYLGMPWSPDGRSIAAIGRDRKGEQGLFQIDAKTGKTVRLVRGNTTPPAWSKDGRTIFYLGIDAREAGKNSIMAFDLRSRKERELYRLPVGYTAPPVLSPDGKYLAFVDNTTLTGDVQQKLLILPVTGGTPQVATQTGVIRGRSLVWAPDGKSIAFPSQDRMMSVDLVTGALKQIGDRVVMPNGRISPDRRRKVGMGGENSYEVWVLENFLPKTAAGQ